MFTENQLVQLEYAVKYVMRDLEHDITNTEDARWFEELRCLLATIETEQQHQATEANT